MEMQENVIAGFDGKHFAKVSGFEKNGKREHMENSTNRNLINIIDFVWLNPPLYSSNLI